MPIDNITREFLASCQTISINPYTSVLMLKVANDKGVYSEKQYDLSGLEVKKEVK